MSLSPNNSPRQNSLDRVWEALEAGGFSPEKRADKFMALCPVHGDSHRSLSVGYDRRNELTMLHCFSCTADVGDITAAIGLTVQDTFDKPLPDRPKSEWGGTRSRRSVAFRAPKKLPPRIAQPRVVADDLRSAKWEPVTRYPYAAADGTIVQEVVREQTVVDGVTHKRFTQRFLGSAGRMVARKPADFAPVLYNHASVLEAIAAGKPVWLVEGEKDADNASALGLIATTNAQGAGSFPEDLAKALAGGTINIVADRDVAGYKRAATLHELFTTFPSTTARILLPAVADEKADLTDHLEAGFGIDDLIEISAEDAGMLAQLGEAHKALAQMEVTKLEATAHMAAATGADGVIHRAHAETWAAEAEARFRRLHDANAGSALLADNYGPEAKAAAIALQTLVDDAAAIAADVHKIVDLPIPNSISSRLKNTTGRVLDFARHGAGAGEPPAYIGNDFIPGDDGAPNLEAKYWVRLGKTVQEKWERDGETYRPRFHTMLHGWAEIQAISYEDNGSGSTSVTVTEMTVKFARWKPDSDGTTILDEDGKPVIEEKTVTWDQEVLAGGTWAQSIPFPGMLETTSRRGKDAAWDAIHKARPGPAELARVYTATGWRKSDLGVNYFVHAGGAITPEGELPIKTRLGGGVQNLKLPAPSTDRDKLRNAWFASTEPLREHIPARAMAPLLGLAWEAPFAPVPLITYIHGAPGAGKSASARQAMHYFAPDLHESAGSTKTILSATAAGGTGLGLTRTLSSANDLPVFVDDFVDDQDVRKAEGKLDSLARSVFDRAPRVVAKQKGGTTETPPINASVIATGQVGIHGSGLQRIFTIGMNPGEIADPVETFDFLETKSLRHARATLGSALIQWLAKNRESLKEQYLDEDAPGASSRRELSRQWMKKVAHLPHTQGAKGRMTTAAVSAIHGIHLMLKMLLEHDALTREEANDFYTWASGGIYEALRRQDGGAGDPGLLTIELLREALASNAAHVTRSDGTLPSEPEQLGWSLRGSSPHDNYIPNGARVGAIKGEGANARLLLFPRVTYDTITRVARGASESFSDTITSIGSSFIAHKWMVADGEGNQTIGRRVTGSLVRVWDLPLSVLMGEADTGIGDPPATGPTEPPVPPSLFDTPAQTDSPFTDEPTPEQPPQTPSAPATAPSSVAETPAAPAVAMAVVAPRRAPLPTSTLSPTKKPFRASLAVLHTDGLWLPDGENIQLSHPISHLGDIAKLVAELNLGTKNGWKTEDGQILVTGDAAMQLGIPVDQLTSSFEMSKKLQELTLDHPLITGAIEAGYQVGGKVPALNTTTRIWHPDNQRLRARFVLLSTLKDDFRHIVDDNPTPLTVARRLQRFADALQTPYAISASTTGIDLMLALHWKKKDEYFAPSTLIPPSEISTLEADIDWQRTPTETEAGQRYIHAYDRGGSYLAGVSGLELGYGEPRYFPDGLPFDKKLPGYWRITMPPKGEWLTPNPIDPRNREDEITGRLTWVTSQTLDIATSLGYEVQIHEAYVWENHTRIYDTWYERVRDARTALDTGDLDDSRARNLLKEVYVRSLGLTASIEHHKNRPAFAPERYHFIQARAKANIIRRIQQIGNDTGRWPVAISKDTVLYTSDELDPKLAWPGKPENYGRGLGQFKYEGTAELAEHLKFLTGRGRYDGKGELTDCEPF